MNSAVARFNGIINDSIRKMLREKRRRLGVSYRDLEEILKSNSSTIRKWELGDTIRCHKKCIAPIRSFLTGVYDQALLERQSREIELIQFWNTLPHQMSLCMERALTVEALGISSEKITDYLVNRINEAADRAIKALVGGYDG